MLFCRAELRRIRSLKSRCQTHSRMVRLTSGTVKWAFDGFHPSLVAC